jgi:hypothetical protein
VPRQAADPGALWVAAMRRGDWRAAWAVNDAVLARRATPPDDPRLPYHLRHVWDGRPFEGRDVLVRCYHGLGDTLQFLRYLASLRARAASVTLEAQPALLPLLGDYQPVPFDVAAPSPPSACDIEIMELAHALRLPPDAVPPPYLSPPPLAGGGRGEGARPRIGLCAQSGDWDRERSVPLPLLAAALPPGASLVRLQPDGADDLPWANPGPLGDIAETAALVCSVDLVITVDTMIAHLAGALGRPAWVLLKAQADWRWMEGERTAWYPSLRLYRQPRPGDWGAPLAAIRRALAASSPAAARAG